MAYKLQSDARVALGAVILGCIVVTPFILLQNLPFVDYPNHLARQYILTNLEQSQHLQRFYLAKTGFSPYWAMRLVVGITSPIVGIDMAGRIFAALAALMPVAGAMAVCLAIHGRLTVPVLAAFAFAYNEPMAWGFQNYAFSAGIAMLVFAAWIRAQTWPVWLRLAIFSTAASGLAALHLLAAGVFAGLALAWETAGAVVNRPSGWVQAGKKASEIAIAMLPVILILFVLRGEDIGITHTIFGDLQLRLTGVVSILWTGWNKFELLLGVWLLSIVGAALWLGIFEISSRCKWFLLVLLAVTMAAPFAFVGVTFISMRLPLVLCLVFAACCTINPRKAKAAVKLGVAAALLGALKISLEIKDLTDRAGHIDEFRATLSQIEPGKRVFSAIDRRVAKAVPEANHEFYRQIVSYAVIDRNSFIPRLFTMYEIGLTPRFAALGRSVSDPVDLELLSLPFEHWPTAGKSALGYAEKWREDYDYLVLIDFGQNPPLPKGTVLLEAGSYFKILKIGATEK